MLITILILLFKQNETSKLLTSNVGVCFGAFLLLIITASLIYIPGG